LRELPLVDLLRRSCKDIAGEECHPVPATVGRGRNVLETKSGGEILQRVQVQNLLQRYDVRA
jgi:hypothetical protein